VPASHDFFYVNGGYSLAFYITTKKFLQLIFYFRG
jgi:hypothetical protein